MPENKHASIHIGQLKLSIPGKSAETGHRVASGVGPNLAEKIPGATRRRLGALSVRVPAPAGATEAEMSAAIAEAITRALGK